MFINQVADATFRAVTGGSYNFPSSYYGVPATGAAFPLKGTIPVAQPKQGTFISQGAKVRGTGTKFLSEVFVGDFIYAQDVIRRVRYVENDDMLTLDQPFPANATATPMLVARGQYESITIRNAHASGAAIVNEAPFAFGGILSPTSPVSYDAAAGTLEITASK
jgi:hypothetical protein